MTESKQPERLKKELSLLSVYALATGTTLSAGFFLLPGLAVAEAGAAVVVSYLIAAALMVPAMLCIVELATAMPRAGGAYYFLDRSLGPLAGTIGGMGTWLALTLKTAFALVGMGAYIGLFFENAPMEWIAVGFALFFGALNIFGSKMSGRFQIVLVCGLLTILTWFIVQGGAEIKFSNFEGFFDKGTGAVISTAGLVFISYVGVTNVASVSEEVKNPERNLPLGVFMALGTAVLIYGLGVAVMVGHVPVAELSEKPNELTPVAAAARTFAGKLGVVIVSVAAILAFSSVANGAIMSASRYPLAMGRDHLLPRFFRRLTRWGTPLNSIIITVAAISVIVFVDPMKIAKLASAFQLLMFALLCLAVIVMRESRIESYDPGYRSPFYPWLHVLGFFAPLLVIGQMGWLSMVFTAGLIALGAGWYYLYARPRVARHGAIYHVFDRLAQHRFYDLDRELRTILKEKGLRREDPFDEVVARSRVIEVQESQTFEDVVTRAAKMLAERLPCPADELAKGFLEGTRTGATPVTGGIALPHLRLAGVEHPEMVIARVRRGMQLVGRDSPGDAAAIGKTFAIFFLVSADNDPGQHLRILAQLATRVDEPGYLEDWLEASDEQRLRETLLREERFLSIDLERGTSTEPLIDCEIRELNLPDGCLVAIIRRDDDALVPRGRTVLREGDRLTVLGDERALSELRAMLEL